MDTNVFVSSFFGGNPRKVVDLWKSGLFAHGFHVVFTAKTPELYVVEKDPDDNKFIECAAALKADFIITGDKALLEIQDYMAIKIVSPRDFLSSYKKLKH